MSKFVIEKKGKLEGNVAVGGCKNAILPILAATLLTEEKCVINAVPPLSDVIALCSMIKEMGIFLDIDQKNSVLVFVQKILKAYKPIIKKLRK